MVREAQGSIRVIDVDNIDEMADDILAEEEADDLLEGGCRGCTVVSACWGVGRRRWRTTFWRRKRKRTICWRVGGCLLVWMPSTLVLLCGDAEVADLPLAGITAARVAGRNEAVAAAACHAD